MFQISDCIILTSRLRVLVRKNLSSLLPVLAAAVLSILFTQSASANTCTTCYIDYENGNDAWNGTSKTFTSGATGPWKHAPGMLGLTPANTGTGDGCASNCAVQVPKAGDSYVLKGGVVWPYTTAPWVFSWGGNSTSSGIYGCAGAGCIYVGYDATWNKGILNAITLNRDLGGCTSAPSVSISGGGGSNAAASANIMPSGVSGVESNVAGFVLSFGISNQGSGYTSPPTVTVTGGGCTNAQAVADISRPILDEGSGSGVAWSTGYGSGNTQYGPGLQTSGNGYIIVDHLEVRNILQNARACGAACNNNPDGVISAFLTNIRGVHTTFSNNYIHGRFTTCVTSNCQNQEQGDRAIILATPADEASGNYVSNGDGLLVGNGSTTFQSANTPYVFSEHSIYGAQGGSVHNNRIYGVRWLVHEGDSACSVNTTIQIYNNEMWLVVYDVGTAHVNELYTLMTCSTLYEYNNVFHNCVSGASNQQQMGNGTTQYFFNNVSWGLGGGTPNYGIDPSFGAGPGGAHFYFYNNTMYANSTATNVCINSGTGNFNSALTVVLQNNHCISSQNPYWSNVAGSTWENQAGSTTAVNVEAATTVLSASTAASQGYTIASLFAPISTTGATVLFANGTTSVDLTDMCSGHLTLLCKDINGNPRPTTGGWQAGAYQTAGSQLLPPTSLTAAGQ